MPLVVLGGFELPTAQALGMAPAAPKRRFDCMAGRDPKAGTSLTNVAEQLQVQHEKCIGINAPCLDEQSIYRYINTKNAQHR